MNKERVDLLDELYNLDEMIEFCQKQIKNHKESKAEAEKLDLENALEEAQAEQFRKDTDERVQSINEAKLEIIKQVRDFLDAIVKATDNFNK